MPRFVWVDGEVLPADRPQITVFDRGFQLGDGIFETLRARGGRLTEVAEHVARLKRAAAGLDIDLPGDIDARLAAGSEPCWPQRASMAPTPTPRSGSRSRGVRGPHAGCCRRAASDSSRRS